MPNISPLRWDMRTFLLITAVVQVISNVVFGVVDYKIKQKQDSVYGSEVQYWNEIQSNFEIFFHACCCGFGVFLLLGALYKNLLCYVVWGMCTVAMCIIFTSLIFLTNSTVSVYFICLLWIIVVVGSILSYKLNQLENNDRYMVGPFPKPRRRANTVPDTSHRSRNSRRPSRRV